MPWDFDYSSLNAINRVLKENGLKMTKKFGQNFLINKSVLQKITSLSGANANTSVWEIGPGLGALTACLLDTGAKVTAFEIDNGFCKVLKEQAFADVPAFCLIQGDILKTWKSAYESKGLPDLICSNLPYNVGSVFIANLIENRCLPETMVYTLQTDVAKRICSAPGQADYSGFTVLLSLDYESKIEMKLKSGCFFPAPKVESTVIKMTKRQSPVLEETYSQAFVSTVHALFSNRRKNIKNNLKNLNLAEETITKALSLSGISETDRAENLSVEQIALLSKKLYY